MGAIAEKQRKAERLVKRWNFFHPPGSDVLVSVGLGRPMKSKTRSIALIRVRLPSDVTPVVYVDGIPNAVSLSRVKPMPRP